MLDFSPDQESQQKALEDALVAYKKLGDSPRIQNKEKIIIVNMAEPSYRKRLYVYNFFTQQFEREHHCAHGVGSSDPYNPANAISFSNTPRSRKTSLGAMYTGETFEGKHGYSRRLYGMEKGINDNISKRGIIIHGAYYCSNEYINVSKKCGRSWGCFALDPVIIDSLIDAIGIGMFMYCYWGE